MDDARICLETVLSAAAAGATCVNYAEVLDVRREGSGFAVRYRDVMSKSEGTVSAAAVVNCAGPWGDRVAALPGLSHGPKLAPTKGVHIVVPRLPLEDALILPSGPDDRVFFVIPWGSHSLIGTTDTPYFGDPDRVEVLADDVDYILNAACRYVPGQTLTRDSISYAFAGLRPLVAPPRRGVAAGAISRRHHIFVTEPGFVTLLGGKYTTFRRMAEQTVDRLLKELGRPAMSSRTRKAPYFRKTYPSTQVMTDRLDLYRHMQSAYGPRSGTAFDFITGDKRRQRPVLDSSAVLMGQLAFALRHERAMRLADLLERRTRLVWHAELSPEVGHAVIDELLPLFSGPEASLRAEADALGTVPAWRQAGRSADV
jgi:glycerol-3-phosphate dehydrogenase